MITLTGIAAINAAEANDLSLSKYADPTEGAREGLTVEEAREIAKIDASLIWVEMAAADAPTYRIESKTQHTGWQDEGSGDVYSSIVDAKYAIYGLESENDDGASIQYRLAVVA